MRFGDQFSLNGGSPLLDLSTAEYIYKKMRNRSQAFKKRPIVQSHACDIDRMRFNLTVHLIDVVTDDSVWCMTPK